MDRLTVPCEHGGGGVRDLGKPSFSKRLGGSMGRGVEV